MRVSGYALATAYRRGDAYLVDRLLAHVKANGGVSTVRGVWDVALDKALWGVKQVDFTLFARGRTDLCLPLVRMAVAHGGRPAITRASGAGSRPTISTRPPACPD